MNFTNECTNSADLQCKCVDYLHFYEPPYDENVYGRQTCGQLRVYRSKTRMLVIKYAYENPSVRAFALEYVSESEFFFAVRVFFLHFWITDFCSFVENEIEASSHPKAMFSIPENTSMSSPFFPNFYPRDFSVEQTFKCDEKSKDDCRLELSFTDFQIAFMSSMEVS